MLRRLAEECYDVCAISTESFILRRHSPPIAPSFLCGRVNDAFSAVLQDQRFFHRVDHLLNFVLADWQLWELLVSATSQRKSPSIIDESSEGDQK
jgi:hypothetical protein